MPFDDEEERAHMLQDDDTGFEIDDLLFYDTNII